MKQHCWHSEITQTLEFPSKDRQVCCYCGNGRVGRTVNSGKHGKYLPAYENDEYVYTEPTGECIERESTASLGFCQWCCQPVGSRGTDYGQGNVYTLEDGRTVTAHHECYMKRAIAISQEGK